MKKKQMNNLGKLNGRILLIIFLLILSTHTVIHRPEVLIEEAVDITPLMDRAFSLQGEEVK